MKFIIAATQTIQAYIGAYEDSSAIRLNPKYNFIVLNNLVPD